MLPAAGNLVRSKYVQLRQTSRRHGQHAAGDSEFTRELKTSFLRISARALTGVQLFIAT